MSVSADRNKKSYLSFLYIVFVGVVLSFGLLGCGSDDDEPVVVVPEGFIKLVSIGLNGAEADNESGINYSAISSNGRYVVFDSDATNLVAGDTNMFSDVYLRDMKSDKITRINARSNGEQTSSSSINADISRDGRYITFIARDDGLVSNDTNGEADVFVYDVNTGDTALVSVNPAGVSGNSGNASAASISDDGRYIVFGSYSSDLVANDTNSFLDIFLRDTVTGTTIRISEGLQAEANGASQQPKISGNGRYVIFSSEANNLVANDDNGFLDAFIWDRTDSSISLISVSIGGGFANDHSFSQSITADGRYILFNSYASNIVSDDTNDRRDVFVRDRQTGTTTRVSVDSNGVEGDDSSNPDAMSDNGRYILMTSQASNLVVDDSNGVEDVFVHDTQTGKTIRVSVDEEGIEGDGDSNGQSISADGRYAVFHSEATNLVSGVTNNIGKTYRVRISEAP